MSKFQYFFGAPDDGWLHALETCGDTAEGVARAWMASGFKHAHRDYLQRTATCDTGPCRDRLMIRSGGEVWVFKVNFRKQSFALERGPVEGQPADSVDHPPHYGGAGNPYEAIKVIEAWGLGFSLGNCLKYIARAGKKGARLEDLKKAQWYLAREISTLEKEESS